MADLTFLQLKALWLISKKKMHGYELMDSLKTNQGTIYPLLQSLVKSKLIAPVKSGRKKEYKITIRGGKTLKSCCTEFCEIYNDIFKEFVCSSCKCGVKK